MTSDQTENPAEPLRCRKCGSTDMVHDAWAEWDHENQCWTVRQVFDHSHCMTCEDQ